VEKLTGKIIGNRRDAKRDARNLSAMQWQYTSSVIQQ